jgi:hypothetical protein
MAAAAAARAHGAERDHWSRTSPLALLYMFTVELLRELFGPSRILGNHPVRFQPCGGGPAVLPSNGHHLTAPAQVPVA